MSDILNFLSSIPQTNLIVYTSIIFCAIIVIFINGIHVKLGSKEIWLLGIGAKLSARDNDMNLREFLKKQTDEIDKAIINDIDDIVDEIEYKMDNILGDEQHCWFTYSRLVTIIKQELYKRVRRNNLKVRLCESTKEKYIERIVNNIREKYDLLQAKSEKVSCGDVYPSFHKIEDQVYKIVENFFDEARSLEIAGISAKIKIYEDVRPKFKTKSMRESSCDEQIAKNKKYLENLTKIC